MVPIYYLKNLSGIEGALSSLSNNSPNTAVEAPMFHFISVAFLAGCLVAACFTASPPAYARGGHHGGGYYVGHHHGGGCYGCRHRHYYQGHYYRGHS